MLLSPSISPASVLTEESMLWLKAIHRRLCQRVSLRRPYVGEIQRNIPYTIFKSVTLMLRNSENFHEPSCYVAKNKKGEVISFTCLRSLRKFFSLLSGIKTQTVSTYFSRKLTGMRSLHKVKVIVTPTSDFGFVYKLSTGQLKIQFHYGEWNACGYPQHIA